jgi:hypothetical protein
MQRRQVWIGVLGLLLTAVAVQADVPKEVTVLGKKYSVEVHSLNGTYTNGTKVELPSGSDIQIPRSNYAFVPGVDEASDQLYVISPIGSNDDVDARGVQFFRLEGSDKNGIFSPATSKATLFFGGVGGLDEGGRPQNVVFVSDVDTGPKKDANIGMFTFRGNDFLRFYDLDTLAGGNFLDNMVAGIVQPADAAAEGVDPDPNMPWGEFTVMAPGPNGTVIVMGRKEQGEQDVEIGILDPSKRPLAFAPVKTDLDDAAQNAQLTEDLTVAENPHALARIGENEYLMLLSTGQGANDDNTASEFLYHLRITPPADLTKEALNSIKVEVLGREDVLALKLHPEESLGGIFGMTAGRNGRLYMGDWRGNIITLSPVATAGQ